LSQPFVAPKAAKEIDKGLDEGRKDLGLGSVRFPVPQKPLPKKIENCG
jgi:hypothetical protein